MYSELKPVSGRYSIIITLLLLSATFSAYSQDTKAFVTSDKIAILTYPAKWKPAKMETGGEITLNAPENSMFKPCKLKLEIQTIEPAYKGYDITEISEVETKMNKANQGAKTSFVINTSEIKKINNKDWWVARGKYIQGKEEFLVDNYKTIHSDKVYILTYVSSEKNFELNAGEVRKMVETFEFLTKDATVYNSSKQDAVPAGNAAGGIKTAAPAATAASTATKEKVIKNATEVLPGKEAGSTGKISFKYAGNPVTYITVRAADGNIWLQQSLGSKKVATELFDDKGRGDLFQWGRWDDSHQIRNPANTRKTEAEPNNPLALNKTGKNPFFYHVISSWWLGSETEVYWTAATPAGVTAENGCDPCKAMGNGWRLPTREEWLNLAKKEFITDDNGGFMSNLKLSAEGYRDAQTAELQEYHTIGAYWTSTPSQSGGAAYSTSFDDGIRYYRKGMGLSIRCIRGN